MGQTRQQAADGEGGALVEIQPKAVRGIESPGMLCAEDELGLGESHDGIITIAPADPLQPGDDAAEKLGFPDEILELAVSPNRPDCLGHVGVARELAANGAAKPWPRLRDQQMRDAQDDAIAIEIEDPDGCPRYSPRFSTELSSGPVRSSSSCGWTR